MPFDPLPDPSVGSDLSLPLDPFVQPFEQAWQAGTRPAIDDYLPADAALRPAGCGNWC